MKTEVRGEAPTGIDERIGAWMPVGPALPSTFFGNMLGETNTLFRKEVFQRLGGFSEDPNYGHEDWELLIRLALHGYKHDIVPEFLLLYRIRRDSHVRSTPGIQNRLRAWRPLFEHLPKEKQFLASSLFVWEWRVDAHDRGRSNSAIAAFEKSWLFQLHRFLRHPRKTALGWITPANRAKTDPKN
jgi:cellulose synthase/poly-beta-1,6-N-acetylglucosamine synthase-like glycosyltransferase